MAKKVISISCPQCKATEATLLGDGIYQCKYCGTRFILDDDTVTQNININVNVKHEHQYESTPSYQTPRKNNMEYEKKVKFGIGCMAIIAFWIIVACISTCFDNTHTDSKQTGTLSEKLIGKYVIWSQPMLHNGRAAFLTVTQQRSGNSKGLALVYADDFEPVEIKCPFRFDSETFPGHLVLPTGDRFVLVSNDIYKFNYDSLRFDNVTDSVVDINEKLKAAGVAAISCKLTENHNWIFVITSSDGRSYSYSPALGKIYENESLSDISDLKIETDTAIYVVIGDKPTLTKNLYHLIISERGIDSKLLKTLSKKPLDMESPELVFQNSRCLLYKYILNGIPFLRKTDIDGNEIFTRKTVDFSVDYSFGLPAKGTGLTDGKLTIINCTRNKNSCYLYVYGDADSLRIVCNAVKQK